MNHVNDTKVQDVVLSNALAGSTVNYGIDYYQREYAWEEKQVTELLDDLFIKFNETYTDGDHASVATQYKQYFLGSYVLSRKENKDYIIDGQQRLTTLMLIFLAIYHLSNHFGEPIQKAKDYVCSDEFDESAFKIDVPERERTMSILLKQENKNIPNDILKSNLYKNYNIIYSYLNDNTNANKLPVFYNWLAKRVLMVSITAYDDNEAYTIFEAMNDRGKSLSNLDMLKGYLLSLVNDEKREKAIEVWSSCEKKFNNNDEFHKFIIELFRAKWARSTTQTNSKKDKNKNEKNDWSEIQKHYHRFIKENRTSKKINLQKPEDALRLFNDIDYYSTLCTKLNKYKNDVFSGYEELCYIDKLVPYTNILYYGLIQPFDDDEDKKIKIISKFLDIRLGLYSWNMLDSTNESNFSTYLVKLIERVKRYQDYNDYNVLAWFFYNEINKNTTRNIQSWGSFDNISPILNSRKHNKQQIYYLLARATSFFEIQNNDINIFQDLYDKKHEIEHVLASNFEANSNTFKDQDSLDRVRNSIGALGLLPKKINGSLNDQSYDYKVKQYPQHNIFLGLLSKNLYKEDKEIKNLPGISKIIKENPKLKQLIKYYNKFDESSIIERENLLRELAKILWNVNDFVNFIDSDLFTTIDEIELFVDNEFVEDEIDLYEEINKKHTEDFQLGDTLYYSNNSSYIEGIYEGKGRICLTKAEFSVSFVKEKESERDKKLGVTLFRIFNNILSNSIIKDSTYIWSGNISGAPAKSLINLAHGKVVGGSIQMDAIKISKDSDENVLFNN